MYVRICMHAYVCVCIHMHVHNIVNTRHYFYLSWYLYVCVCVDAFALLYIHNYVCSDQLMALVDCIYAHYDIGPG